LYLPYATISLVEVDSGWQVVERDDHGVGLVPVVQFANRQRVSDRAGRSEITPAVMSITDAACRTLDRKSTRLNSSHVKISYAVAVSDFAAFPTRRSSDLLYLPYATISLVEVDSGWQVVERDDHGVGLVPVVQFANRQRVSDRAGRSEITPAVMSITDAACRT